MARALSRDARLIVMDEPSAVLDGEEVENLFPIVRDLAAPGVAVVYISHRLEEIRRIGDRITVLKDGRTVATGLDARTTPTAELIRLMTGRTIEYVVPRRARGRPPTRRRGPGCRRPGPAQRVRGRLLRRATGRDRRPGRPCRRRSERDHRDDLRCAAADSGTVERRGPALRNGSVRRRGRGRDRAVPGGAQVPGPDARSGGLPEHLAGDDRAVRANASFLDEAAERRAAKEQVEALDVRPADPDRSVRTLSGGNQQKMVLARWLLHGCRVLLLDEPTRGVDVGARSEIYVLIRKLADSGRRRGGGVQ